MGGFAPLNPSYGGAAAPLDLPLFFVGRTSFLNINSPWILRVSKIHIWPKNGIAKDKVCDRGGVEIRVLTL